MEELPKTTSIQTSEYQSEKNKLENKYDFFKNHILYLFLFFCSLILIILGTLFYYNNSTSWLSQSIVQTWLWNNIDFHIQKPQQNDALPEISIINQKKVNSLIFDFMTQVQSWWLNDALEIYDDILKITNNHPLFTGKNDADWSRFNKLDQINQNLILSQENLDKSSLYLDKSITEYNIWNDLYFYDKNKYWPTILYYYIRSILSADMSIKNSNNALAHRYKWVVLLDIWTFDELAIEELQTAILLDKTDIVSYYKLWNALRGIGYYRSAIDTYLLGLSVNPNHELIQNNLWISYFDLWSKEEWFKTLSWLLLTCKEYCNFAHFNFANQLSKEKWRLDYVKIMIHINKAIEEAKLKNEIYRNAYHLKWKLMYASAKDNSSNLNYHQVLLEVVKLFILALNDPNDKQLDVNMLNQNGEEELSFYYIVEIYDQLWDRNSMLHYLELWLDKFPNSTRLQRFLRY